MLKEFREFALRGNVIDLAVGVVIGAAFGKLVEGVVKGIINPIVAFATSGGTEAGRQKAFDELWNGVAALGGGIGNFLILAAVVFFVFVKPMNKLKAMMEKKAEVTGPPETPADIKLLAEIRDLLKGKA